MKHIKLFESFNDNLESDAIGYSIGDYVYHITPIINMSKIQEGGFVPRDGISIDGKSFKNRLYFATSLISAYDLSVNFGSYKEDVEYIIFKLRSDCINEYERDSLFNHGIYVDYPISYNYVVDIIKADDLIDKFDYNDIEDLY